MARNRQETDFRLLESLPYYSTERAAAEDAAAQRMEHLVDRLDHGRRAQKKRREFERKTAAHAALDRLWGSRT